MNKVTTTALLATLLCPPLYAADIAGAVRNGEDEPDTSNGGFLEVGLMGKAVYDPRAFDRWDEDPSIGVIVAGEYRYNGLFVEAINGSSDGLNLGYTFLRFNMEDPPTFAPRAWTVDLIAFNGTSGDTQDVDPNLGDTARTIWLLDRDPAMTGAGLRTTGYIGDYIVQFRLLDDVWNGHGAYGTARVGRSWQYRNWNFHAIVGAEYLDAQYSERMYGVSVMEATSMIPAYSPGSTVAYETEVGVTYPVREHWVFRGTLRHKYLPAAVAASPLYDERSATSFLASLSYVF